MRLAKKLRTMASASRYLVTVRGALPRYLVVLVLIGLLPIPGPVDEGVLLVAMTILWLRHRPLLRVCWAAALLDL
jgi:hypothetical protein